MTYQQSRWARYEVTIEDRLIFTMRKAVVKATSEDHAHGIVRNIGLGRHEVIKEDLTKEVPHGTKQDPEEASRRVLRSRKG